MKLSKNRLHISKILNQNLKKNLNHKLRITKKITERQVKHTSKKLGGLPKAMKLKNLIRDELLMAFDATSLYPIAMYDSENALPEFENDYAFKKDMNASIIDQINKTIEICISNSENKILPPN